MARDTLGAMAAVPPTGVSKFVIRDGTIASNLVVFDEMQLARQIGLLPPDGSAADRATRAAFNATTRLAARLRDRRRRWRHPTGHPAPCGGSSTA